MVGTILLFRDEGERPRCEIVLDSGDRVALELDGAGLTVTRLGSGSSAPLFKAPPATVAALCAGLVGAGSRSEATPLRILAAAAQRIGSAHDIRAAFEEAAAGL